MDQIPISIVNKTGFRNLVEQLDRGYEMPRRKYFSKKEIPALYNETRSVLESQLSNQPYFACTTDLWTSRTVDAYMAVTIQFISDSWEMQSWCLGCAAMLSDHTGENIREVLEETITQTWKLDMACLSGITTDNASLNIKAFKGNSYHWVPCFGHNLHLAVNKATNLDRVASCLSRLRKTICAFSRSNKMTRLLKEKQQLLHLPDHKLVHDEPTRWGSTFDMVDRFCEQQQAVCAALAENRNKWCLMPSDTDITTVETVREVLGPLSAFTDALCGEKETTLNSVIPVMWKILSHVQNSDTDSVLTCNMKTEIRKDLEMRYSNENLQILLNSATFFDPRFKNTFVTKEKEVTEVLLQKAATADLSNIQSVMESTQAEQEEQTAAKKQKQDLGSLLSSIVSEKKRKQVGNGDECQARRESQENSADRLNKELQMYKSMEETNATENPVSWWKRHESSLPILSVFAKYYLCIPASSSASERVFSTSGLICSPLRSRLSSDNIDTLVFLSKNKNVTI